MERIVNISKNAKEADKWDKHQHHSLTPQERQRIAHQLQVKVYGSNNPDIKEAERNRGTK
tara:strand:- start:22390 stop:22569 length:180 start_codon:yes stop_codon:yes gene_type:complete